MTLQSSNRHLFLGIFLFVATIAFGVSGDTLIIMSHEGVALDFLSHTKVKKPPRMSYRGASG